MIKAVITDVDGVMVGKQEGINFPLPHDEVIDALHRVFKSGVPVILCTAKFHPAIDDIIAKAKLNNPHITDGGALVINPFGNKKIIKEYAIENSVIEDYLEKDEVYSEVFSADNYYIRKDSDPDFIKKRLKLLQKKPIYLDNLTEIIGKVPLIKMISLANDESEKIKIDAQLKHLGNRVNSIWSQHPYLGPRRICIITAPGVSKGNAVLEIADYLGIALDDILGIGDQPSDWSFMELCGHVATIGDSKELQDLAASRDSHYIGKSVDDNSLIDVFGHYELI